MKKKILIFTGIILILNGCSTRQYVIPKNQKPLKVNLLTTGYCKCEKCCGWKRNWLFKPVIAYGPNKGKPKAVGITSSGTRAKKGTIAADTKIYPYGTIMFIPDYGWGKVEDIGSAIKGNHIDLFFSSHKKALSWGRQNKTIYIWKPK